MSELPEPLTPADCDLQDQGWFPFYVDKLRSSRWWRKASHLARSINVDLWAAAWKEVPAASLPDDDQELAQLAGYGRDVEGWKAVREEVLAPWLRTSDGRLYHRTLSEAALDVFERKQKREENRAADAERKRIARAALAERAATKKGKKPKLGGEKTSGECPPDVRSITTQHNTGQNSTLEFDASASVARWKERLPRILAECPKIDAASPAIRSEVGPLVQLEREGCDPDLDIVPAIMAISDRWTGRKRMFSWRVDALAETAHGNRELRLKGLNNGRGTSRSARGGSQARGMAGVAERRMLLAGDDAQRDDGRSGPRSERERLDAMLNDDGDGADQAISGTG